MSKTNDASTKVKASTEQFTEPFFDIILFSHPPSYLETRLTAPRWIHDKVLLMVVKFTESSAQLWKLQELGINASSHALIFRHHAKTS